MELGTSTSFSGADSWKPDLLPERPDTQTTALGHVCQILLGLSHVPVDGLHALLNALQLLCEEHEFYSGGFVTGGAETGSR